MAILNITPDSFSDGGRFISEESKEVNLEKALVECERIINQGADIIDVGGESTRPNADFVPDEEEISRIVPILENLPNTLHSVDTRKPSVAKKALEQGCRFINDVRGEDAYREKDEKGLDMLYEEVAKDNASICIMHARGTPETMNSLTEYRDVVSDVSSWLQNEVHTMVKKHYIPRWNIWIDPGLGFAKSHDQHLEFLNRLEELKQVHNQVLLGTSRKRFIRSCIGDKNIDLQDVGTAASSVIGAMKGAQIFRVHDVRTNRAALDIVDRVLNQK